jgi:hypothetical protein
MSSLEDEEKYWTFLELYWQGNTKVVWEHCRSVNKSPTNPTRADTNSKRDSGQI